MSLSASRRRRLELAGQVVVGELLGQAVAEASKLPKGGVWKTMSLTISITPELEARLREEASRSGIDASTFVAGTLEERLRWTSAPVAPHLPRREATLLQKINQGLPESVWLEYDELIGKRQDETLTPRELERLIDLGDRIEEAHVARMALVAELAGIRHVPLETLMGQLGVRPHRIPDACSRQS